MAERDAILFFYFHFRWPCEARKLLSRSAHHWHSNSSDKKGNRLPDVSIAKGQLRFIFPIETFEFIMARLRLDVHRFAHDASYRFRLESHDAFSIFVLERFQFDLCSSSLVVLSLRYI